MPRKTANLLERRLGEVRRASLPRTPVHSHLFALLRFDLYTRHPGDGSHLTLPLFGWRRTGRTGGLMAPDRTEVLRGEECSLTALEAREESMNLTRLAFPQHPRPPQRELRQRDVFDSGGGLLGYVANVYVNEERNFRFLDI